MKDKAVSSESLLVQNDTDHGNFIMRAPFNELELKPARSDGFEDKNKNVAYLHRAF